ncbi:helix-turn-helix transcriptional regulator [Actinospica durhamensis]|uniref:Helix-turn-helix transcriptional regulator n=1 Tax=Actinospica durhamensis TaxID=1508375 RepID=A0A941EXM1_9ACTN|nr:winged helix-turn-helix domain-containing protein [Actinospica durhamensis]MBR7839198.1 helix-turn-helix transcriptional regulator [Actinospica durhamensis]
MPHDEKPELLNLETDEQLRAIASHARHRVLAVLRDGPATITQIAAQLGIAKGSSSYHVRVLEKAGMVHVVETRKVRGVVERYYAIPAQGLQLPRTGPGQPEIILRHALADIEAAPEGGQKLIGLKHVRLSAEVWEQYADRLRALLEDMTAASDPTQPAASLSIAFFRPKDHKPADASSGEHPTDEDEEADKL